MTVFEFLKRTLAGSSPEPPTALDEPPKPDPTVLAEKSLSVARENLVVDRAALAQASRSVELAEESLSVGIESNRVSRHTLRYTALGLAVAILALVATMAFNARADNAAPDAADSTGPASPPGFDVHASLRRTEPIGTDPGLGSWINAGAYFVDGLPTGSPPARCEQWDNWLAMEVNGGGALNRIDLTVTAQGNGEATVLLNGLDVRATRRTPVPGGTAAICRNVGGADASPRTIFADTSTEPPTVRHFDPVTGDETPFLISLADGESEVFQISILSTVCTTTWELDLLYIADGVAGRHPVEIVHSVESGDIVIDNPTIFPAHAAAEVAEWQQVEWTVSSDSQALTEAARWPTPLRFEVDANRGAELCS